MYTKKIIIKGEEHFNEVVKSLKSNCKEYCCGMYYGWVGALVFDSKYHYWYRVGKENVEKYKSVPEYEIVTKTSYELKEVPSIVCSRCAKKHYKDSETYFKISGDFLIEKDNKNDTKVIDYDNRKYFCRDCLIEEIAEYIGYVEDTNTNYTFKGIKHNKTY